MIVNLKQPQLIEFGEATTPSDEDLPKIWIAAEALISSELDIRWEGFNRIEELKAIGYSPLLAYLVTTRINEVDLKLRAQIVKLLGETLGVNYQGEPVSDQVLIYLHYYLSQMRTRTIFSLLQVVDFDETLVDHAVKIFQKCSYAGNHLSDILMDRKASIAIRKLAVDFIGRIGYLEAIPTLERLESRLATRLNGQIAMLEMPFGDDNEASILPLIRTTLERLRAP